MQLFHATEGAAMNDTIHSIPLQQAEVLLAGQWQASRDATGSFRAADPTTGEAIGPQFPVSGADDIETAIAAAQAVAAELAAASVEQIAAFLDAYADALDADADTLVALAHAETALPAPTRLRGNELPRTSGQLRQAAQAVRSYSWTQPIIDTAADLRSHLAPLGKPVLVFGPNNFPFAFNAIAGSDFASAIAARNPVIAKAHPLHPATSQRMAQLAHAALVAAGLPAAAVQLLYHFDNAIGVRLAGDARLGAIGFTGSRAGGLALKAAADAAGVPFYAELSSVNPVFLLPGALVERGAALAQDFFSSCTLGSGQFCTNPGVVVVPHGEAGDAFVAATTAHFDAAMPMVLFSSSGVEGVQRGVAALRAAGAALLAGGAYRRRRVSLCANLVECGCAGIHRKPAGAADRGLRPGEPAGAYARRCADATGCRRIRRQSHRHLVSRGRWQRRCGLAGHRTGAACAGGAVDQQQDADRRCSKRGAKSWRAVPQHRASGVHRGGHARFDSPFCCLA